MRFWFDTEFIEDGKTIELVSIGIVSEDGREYYAEAAEAVAHFDRADQWVKDNVIAHLSGVTKPRQWIADEIVLFLGERPELWAYYADYDWVVLCQLYGRMIDLPATWPRFCRDVKQLCDSLGNPTLPKQTGKEHHALEDAHWNWKAWKFLQQRKAA